MISENFNIISEETSHIKWSAAILPKEGEKVCGDLYFVKKQQDKILFSVIDGLGHGPKAARVSRKVAETMEHNSNESFITIIKHCHRELIGTRGAVLGFASINLQNHELSWICIGNVEGTLHTKKENQSLFKNIVSRGGVVGYNLPALQVSTEPISDGDILIFSTDGVNNEYVDHVEMANPISSTTRFIAKNYHTSTDDSLILAIRFKNGRS